jgi:hypothetical protein
MDLLYSQALLKELKVNKINLHTIHILELRLQIYLLRSKILRYSIGHSQTRRLVTSDGRQGINTFSKIPSILHLAVASSICGFLQKIFRTVVK